MKPPKINFLNPDRAALSKRRRFSYWRSVIIGFVIIFIVIPGLISITSMRLINAANNLNPSNESGGGLSLVEQVRFLVGNDERQLSGEESDRINILVLGEGGVGHDGPHLTDTILFTTIQPSTGKVGILSLPRDLWVALPDKGKGKINAANAYAEQDKARSGGIYTSKTISALLQQPIDYYIRIDFSAFQTLIDDVGGVTVNVEREFTDFAYPTDDDLYQKVHFNKGWQTISGERALQYVRSRHGNNGEGSDFARSRRQQKVVAALKEKIVSFDTLLKPSRVASILETLESHVITNMELWEIVKLAKMARGIDLENLSHFVLDDNPEGPLYASTIPLPDGDAYVLLPRKGDWSEVRKIASNIITYKDLPELTSEKVPVKIEVQNGTIKSGLAAKTRDQLEKVGYEVIKIGNADKQNYSQTVIYDLTNGGDPETLHILKNLLNAEIALTLPGFLSSGITASDISLTNKDVPKLSGSLASFLVIIGNNNLN